MKTIKFENYEITSLDDTHGLVGRFDTEEKVLEEINRSYIRAKEQGFDNSHEKWLIVCNQTVRTFTDDGVFQKEEICRFVIGQVEYNFYEDAFVFVY